MYILWHFHNLIRLKTFFVLFRIHANFSTSKGVALLNLYLNRHLIYIASVVFSTLGTLYSYLLFLILSLYTYIYA